MKSQEVYIGTGEKCGFYTLHLVSIGEDYFKDNYIKNLSTDWETAYNKAKGYADRLVAYFNPTVFELDEFGKMRGEERWNMILRNVNHTIIPFGKHKDATPEQVIKDGDIQYLWWMVKNMIETKDENIPFRVYLACVLADSGQEDPAEIRQREYEARKIEDERITAGADPVPITEQRIKLTGIVLSTKIVKSYYGSSTKMLFRDDNGFKLWGTAVIIIDNDGRYQDIKGQHIEFVARIQRSDADEKFGFFKRPTKAKLI